MGGSTFAGISNSIRFQRDKFCAKNKTCATCEIKEYCEELAKAERILCDVAGKLIANAMNHNVMGYVKE